MKKIIKLSIKLFMCVVLMLSLVNIFVLAEPESNDGIKVLVNGEKVEFDVEPFMKNDIVMVPFRRIAEAMNIVVEWNDETSTITGYLLAYRGDAPENKCKYLTVKIHGSDSLESTVGEAEYDDKKTNIAVTVKDDRTCIPLRFFAEAFGAEVSWYEDINMVTIKTKPLFDKKINTEYSLLNGRLYISSLNSCEISDNNTKKTTLTSQKICGDQLIITAVEQFAVSSGNMKKDAQCLGYLAVGEVINKDEFEILEYNAHPQNESESPEKIICGYLIKDKDNRLITLNFLTNEYSLNRNGTEKYKDIINPIIDSLRLVDSKINIFQHTENISSYYTITLFDHYILYYSDSDMIIEKIVNVEEIHERPYVILSDNIEENYFAGIDNISSIAGEKEGKLCGEEIIWYIYSNNNMYSEFRQECGKYNLYGFASNEYDQNCIINMIKSIKLKTIYNSGGVPIAAKPVIYLYPEAETKVDVKLDISGEFGFTYPEYNNGWSVTAKPDGTVICDDKEYSYLFWEGTMPNFKPDFKEGFVIKGSDSAEFLRNILAEMGLTPREYNEFIVYWAPKLQENEYNKIYFAGEEYENEAKLNITPKPDSILRVYMVYEKAEENTVLPPQEIKPFERKGFTVVEWGGRLI
ncbi:MAG: copper amine oxidase N-terminal domain-containing protein [Clostridiales bacterium]|nr:copper amine oxidase N-terminal domain-containing protein [Clostridiales bacterium]